MTESCMPTYDEWSKAYDEYMRTPEQEKLVKEMMDNYALNCQRYDIRWTKRTRSF
jgi:hypothetical protein